MQEETYGTRDRAYSAWHRRMSTRRFIGIDRAQLLAMIDLDAALYVEYDNGSKEPLTQPTKEQAIRFPASYSGLTIYYAMKAGSLIGAM